MLRGNYTFHREWRHAIAPSRLSNDPKAKLAHLVRVAKAVAAHYESQLASTTGGAAAAAAAAATPGPLVKLPGAELVLRAQLLATQLRVVALDEFERLVSLLDDLEFWHTAQTLPARAAALVRGPRFFARLETLEGSALSMRPYSSQCSLSSAQA